MRESMKTVSGMRQVTMGAMAIRIQEAFVQLFSTKQLRNLLLVILVGSGLLVYGQGTSASLTGQVTDPFGAAITGASVTITNVGTDFAQTVKTDAVGEYLLRPLPVGSYSLSIDAKGFDRYVQTGIVLTANLSATQDVHLKVGTGKETVNVTADAELLNTTSAELGTTVGEEAISELPLNGRDPSTLVLLAPGTANVMQRGGEGIQSGFSLPTETGASSGGGRQGSTYYMLDGVSNMDNYNDLTAPFPNSDATQEFKVITNNFSAIYGFSPGAVVSIATKGGTNAFHGGAFWFVRNNDLNAADYFVHSVDPLKRNQFGAYTGGPIIKNKLFFFGNYQGTRLVQAANSNQTYTPTSAMLTGDFSGLASTPGVTNLTGPFHTVNGMANQLDTTIAKLDTAAVQIANDGLPKKPQGLPTATTQAADGEMYYTSAAVSQSFNEFTGRLDYDLSPTQRLTLRSFTNSMTEPSGDTPGNVLSVLNLANWSYDFQERIEYYNDVLEHTWTINPSTVNSVSVFWTEQSAHNSAPTDDSSGKPMCWSRYINVSELPGQCWMEGFGVSGGSGGFNGGWTEPSQEVRNTYGFSDTLIKTLSRHTLSAGIDLQHQFAEELTQYPTQPIVTFNGHYTGNGLADFLLGYMSGFEQGAGEIADVAGWQVGPYFQDDWRLRPNLTVNLGVRWDPNLAPTSAGGRGAAFVAGQQSTRFPNAPLGLIFPGDKGVTTALMPDSYGYWEPRLGVAWQPKALPHTVFHAGFGLFTGPLEYSSYNHAADIAPFSPTFSLYGSNCSGGCSAGADAPVTGWLSLDNPWSTNASTGNKSPFPPFASVSYVPPSSSPIAAGAKLGQSFSRNFKMGMTQSWNVSVEQQLNPATVLRVAYVGNESYHQSDALDENAYIYSASAPSGTAPYPSFSNLYELDSNGTASYNSLQATIEHHVTHGLQVQSSFTWSKAIDVASSGNISFGSPYLPDPFDLRWNRGVSSLSIPFNSVTNFIYHAPSFRGKSRLLQETLGGWEFSSIVTWQSGNPFTIQSGASNNSGSNQYLDRADRVSGQPLNVHQGSRSQWLKHYFNTAAFVNNAPGTFGNSGKDIMFGPHYFGDDSAIMKTWSLVEGINLQFRWEAFNALNHPTFGNPTGDYGNTVTWGGFGQVGTTGNVPPRVMQGALKLTF
ncbi:MAG: carboxypeptidase regulatory-like domain-containing protein [Terracidiphilus sp.]